MILSNFKKKFIGYSNYINSNGNDIDYIEKCIMYKEGHMSALDESEMSELKELIKEYQLAVHQEDGLELYRKYFELGGREGVVFENFLTYLWFWGDYDDFIVKLREYMEQGNEIELDRIARSVVREGLDGLKKIYNTTNG